MKTFLICLRLFCFAMFSLLAVSPICSQEEDGTIVSVEIDGLRRTVPRVARYPLEIFIGRDGATLDMNEVQATIRDTGLLEPIAAELVETENGIVLRVTVEERWAIFPAPMFMANAGDFNVGLFFVDRNAFGLFDMMGLGLMYGTSGLMVMAMYHYTPDGSGLPGLNFSFMYARQESKDLDRYETMHRFYNADRLRFSLDVRHPFFNIMTLSSSFSFTGIFLEESIEDYNPPEQGAMLLGFGLGLSMRRSNWDGFLLSQRRFSVGVTYNHALSSASYWQADFRGIFEQSLVPGFRLTMRSGAVWKSEAGDGTDPLFESSPQRAQVDILPRRFSARHHAGISAGLERYIVQLRWGTLSILGSWQAAFSYGPISGAQFNHGPYGGLRFYMTRLAMPAFGMGVAYNMNSGLLQFAINMGMEF